ncbi:MAG: prolyl oligopeptidase family serine peptidase [Balneolaceae bacterium]|nr:prolyl oligopeptidase family serine peptidase [Balneolaceae bacterium]
MAQNKQLTFEDVMKWEDISDTQISANGEWIVYSVWPDRGDGEVRVRSVSNDQMFTIELGNNPKITKNGRWVGAEIEIPLAKQLKAKNGKAGRQGMSLLNTTSGETISMDSVQSFTFSNDGKWLAIHRYQSKEIEDLKSKNKQLGTELIVRNLADGSELSIPFVSSMSFDSTSSHLAYSVVDTSAQNGIYVRDLSDARTEQAVHQQEHGFYNNLSWDDGTQRLAFVESTLDDDFEPGDANLHLWNAKNEQLQTLVSHEETPGGWALRSNNNLDWTQDGERLYFGFMDQEMVNAIEANAQKDTTESIDIYDREQILDEKGVDVWHWDDPLIKTHEKNTWNYRKNQLYRAVYHINDNKWVQLADKQMPDVDVSENANVALGSSNIPYRKLMTWSGFFDDVFVVNLQSGERTKVAEKLRSGAELSPGGNFVVFYRDKNWHLYDINEDVYTNLTESLDIPFYNEDHDYPSPAQGYGVAGWMKSDDAVLIYDKYDIWKFPTDGGQPINLTEDGRDRQISYRIQQLDPEKWAYGKREELLLEGYYEKKKTYGFYTLRLNRTGTQKRLEEPKKFDFIAKAEDSNRFLYTRESYDEYPNVWLSDDISFKNTQQLTSLHMDLHDTYNWGTAELIKWKSLDGKDIQGAVIKPDTYEEGKKYPVLIYYYRFFSQRAYEFNSITNDDRPTLPQWVSDNYVVFLPDIRFEVGEPGFASTKSLVPGVHKLIEMGIADPDKLGLHGHSWSGYQTAFMVTQTDIFDAAIAGAPVSNMTSAYSGIRWGSGLARQFQYEQTQSRLGGSLFEYPERYIENSPVFYADRIETPMLIMFGDEDTAVPWYQGIELYLALRRLEKDAVFLQYRGEPHHLQEYANRLDYAIKMKEYFDHYLRGEKAPDWITEGVPYRGK